MGKPCEMPRLRSHKLPPCAKGPGLTNAANREGLDAPECNYCDGLAENSLVPIAAERERLSKESLKEIGGKSKGF